MNHVWPSKPIETILSPPKKKKKKKKKTLIEHTKL